MSDRHPHHFFGLVVNFYKRPIFQPLHPPYQMNFAARANVNSSFVEEIPNSFGVFLCQISKTICNINVYFRFWSLLLIIWLQTCWEFKLEYRAFLQDDLQFVFIVNHCECASCLSHVSKVPSCRPSFRPSIWVQLHVWQDSARRLQHWISIAGPTLRKRAGHAWNKYCAQKILSRYLDSLRNHNF